MVSQEWGCSYYIDKDFNVVTKKKSHGVLYINLDFSRSKKKLCVMNDKDTIQPVMLKLATDFKKVMDKQAQYDSIMINVFTMDKSISGLETIVCPKIMKIPLSNMENYKYEIGHVSK